MIRSKQSLDGRGKAIGRFRRAAGLALAGLWLGVTAKAQIPVPDANWTHRTNIIFYGYDRGETLTNFPALVVLSTNVAGFSYEQFASPSGYDLRFANADETEGLPCEIEQWAANGRSYVWVKVPELTNSATVWAYWGNTNATAQQAYTTNGAAWDAGFRGVWHLSESAGTTAFDSTANRNYGAKKSAGEPAALAGGVVGGGQRWDGSDDFIDIPSAASLDMGAALTCSAWVRWDGGAVPDWPSLASRFEGTPNAWHIQLTTAHSGTNYPDKDNTLTIQSENYTPGSGEIDVTNTVPSWSSAAWYHVTVVFSNGPVSVCRDGVYRGGGTILPVQDNGATITLGHRSTHPTWGCVWNGAQDEVRLAAGARSSNWIWASYMTMASNAAFTSFGSIPPPPQNPPQIGNSIGATGVTANAAFLNGSLTSTGTAATAVWAFFWARTRWPRPTKATGPPTCSSGRTRTWGSRPSA